MADESEMGLPLSAYLTALCAELSRTAAQTERSGEKYVANVTLELDIACSLGPSAERSNSTTPQFWVPLQEANDAEGAPRTCACRRQRLTMTLSTAGEDTVAPVISEATYRLPPARRQISNR